MSNMIVSILTVLVMLFNLCGGFMADLDAPVSAGAQISVNTEVISQLAPALMGADAENAEQMQATAKLVGEVLNVLSLHGTADRDAVELRLMADDEVIVNLGIRQDENGLTAASSLLDGQVLNVSAETAAAINEQLEQSGATAQLQTALGSASAMDPGKVSAGLFDALNRALERVAEKAGEAQNGEYAVDELEFVSCQKVDITADELLTIVLEEMKEYLSQPELTQLAQMGGSGNPAGSIDEALAGIQENGSGVDAADVSLYTDAAGDRYLSVTLEKQAEEEDEDSQWASVNWGNVAECSHLHGKLGAGEAMIGYLDLDYVDLETWAITGDMTKVSGLDELAVSAAMSNGETVSVISGAGNGTVVSANLQAAKDESGDVTNFNVSVVLNSEALQAENAEVLKLSGYAGKTGGITVEFGGDKEVLAVEGMLTGEDETTPSLLMMNALFGAMNAIGKLTAHLPEETAEQLNTLLTTMTTGAAPVPAE